MRSVGTTRRDRPALVPFAFLWLVAFRGAGAQDCPDVHADCVADLDEATLSTLVLNTYGSSVQPGERISFVLGVWECCTFIRRVPACVEWSVSPAGAATVELGEEGPSRAPFPSLCPPNGSIQVHPTTPHGTTLTLTANVESRRKLLDTEVSVFTPELNPLVGFWAEVEQVSCPSLIRGDVDQSSAVEISDAVRLFVHLFLPDAPLGCDEAGDTNGDHRIDIADGVYLLNYLFGGGPPPDSPFPRCGPDPGPTTLGCATFAACDPGPAVTAAVTVNELVFEANGLFTVTWLPLETYVDYWGSYDYDLETGRLSLHVEGGNYVPPDLESEGTFTAEGTELRLSGVWLGSPEGQLSERRCGHRFGKR